MKVRIPNNGGAGNMQSMLKQAQKMQEDMQALQADLEAREYSATAGGGVCTVRMNGKHEVLSIELDPEVVDPDDVETLQDILVAAVNEVTHTVDETAAQEMGKITGPMGMGGMPGLF